VLPRLAWHSFETQTPPSSQILFCFKYAPKESARTVFSMQEIPWREPPPVSMYTQRAH
jgi:hypothetical protein